MEKLDLDFYYGKESEQFTFYRLPKALITDERFKGITNNAKLLYGLMLDRMSLSKKRGWLDEENKVFIKYSLNNIEEDLNVSRKTAGSILKELEAIGLIDMVQQTGVANVIYVKNFVSEGRLEARKQRYSEDEWLTGITESNENVLSKIGISIGKGNKMELDEEALKKSEIGTLKTLFTGHNSFASKVSMKANSISNAAARASGTYKSNGTYNNALSELASSKVDKEV